MSLICRYCSNLRPPSSGSSKKFVLTAEQRLLSRYRPVCPIFMVTRNATASRYSHLYRGVYPFLFPEEKPDFTKVNWQEDVDRRLKWGISRAIELGVLKEGRPVVVVQGWRGGAGRTNTVRIVRADVSQPGHWQL